MRSILNHAAAAAMILAAVACNIQYQGGVEFLGCYLQGCKDHPEAAACQSGQ